MLPNFLLLLSVLALYAVGQELNRPVIPTLPLSSFRGNTKLPNPFVFLGGQRATSKADWECCREEIRRALQSYEFGPLPGPPTTVIGAFSGNILTVTVTERSKTISFNATNIRGSDSGTSLLLPAIIGIAGSSLPALIEVAVITFPSDDIAQQVGASSRGVGKFYTLYGRDHLAGALIAWTWVSVV